LWEGGGGGTHEEQTPPPHLGSPPGKFLVQVKAKRGALAVRQRKDKKKSFFLGRKVRLVGKPRSGGFFFVFGSKDGELCKLGRGGQGHPTDWGGRMWGVAPKPTKGVLLGSKKKKVKKPNPQVQKKETTTQPRNVNNQTKLFSTPVSPNKKKKKKKKRKPLRANPMLVVGKRKSHRTMFKNLKKTIRNRVNGTSGNLGAPNSKKTTKKTE